MGSLPARDLQAEIRKHFHGTPEERMLSCLRLGSQALDLFCVSLPESTTRGQARAIMQRNKNRGRQPSALMEPRLE